MSSYLRVENWPECIPWTEPTREYEPQAWRPPTHEDPHGLDTYPNIHPDAGSISDDHLGDVCPWCGVPVRRSAEVVVVRGYRRGRPNADRGIFHRINDVDNPVPGYHVRCWENRQMEPLDLTQTGVSGPW